LYTHLEDYINSLYKRMGITQPKQLDMHRIAKLLGLEITYDEEKIFYFSNEISLRKSTKVQEWIDFAHEVCHHLKHVGIQLVMHPLFIDLQEYQASHFAYHFCVPTFMLENVSDLSVRKIMNLFNVEYEFAERRLEMYKNKLLTMR